MYISHMYDFTCVCVYVFVSKRAAVFNFVLYSISWSVIFWLAVDLPIVDREERERERKRERDV